MDEARTPPAAHLWAAELVRDWNENLVGRIAARLSRDVVVEAPSRKGGAPGKVLAFGRAAYMAQLPQLRATIGTIELVSALADDVSASVVLKDEHGTAFTVLLSFDDRGRILRIRSYARESLTNSRDRPQRPPSGA